MIREGPRESVANCLVPKAVPACAKEPIFGLSPAQNCGYIEKAQRFPDDN
jgi:hypothetical protein